MKLTKKLLCAVLALTMLLSLMLTGCSAPKLVIGGTPAVAGTVDGTTITTGEYLAYLYSTFYSLYYEQGYYQYAAYGYDVWSQDMEYGEGDDAQTVKFAEYIQLVTADRISRQEALRQMLKEEKIDWDEERVKELQENIKELGEDSLLSLGISNENYIKANEQLQLNEPSLLYGRYGKGGTQEISQDDLRAYFDKNYLSYKVISIELTDSEGEELSEAEQKKITDQLDGYLKSYNKDKNFEAVMDTYNKANAAEGEEVEKSTDEGNRINLDATQTDDEDFVKAVRTVKVGEAKVVTYKAGGSTPTAALILRLDTNKPATLFEDENENIIYGMKYEDFDKEVDKRVEKIKLDLKKSVVSKCDPYNFVTDAQ